MNVPGLTLQNIGHRFDGVTVLDDVSLEVATGELVCLLGPSGCGKTTLLRLAAGLEPLQAGKIAIHGQTMASGGSHPQIPPERRGVGLMFQDYALFPHLNVFDNVRFGIRKRDWGRLSWVTGALRDVGLADFAMRYPHTLSGGQQQRIALLRALAPSPRVVLLDEPFSGLDENLRKQVRRETLKILSAVKVAGLMVTHDPEEAMYLADRIVVMSQGKVLQAAAPLEVYQSPVAPFVARMLGDLNEFEVEVAQGVVKTPLFELPSPGIPDGAKALVMIRAEAVRLSTDAGASGCFPAVVERARPLGAMTHLDLSVPALDGRPEARVNVQAHVPGDSPDRGWHGHRHRRRRESGFRVSGRVDNAD